MSSHPTHQPAPRPELPQLALATALALTDQEGPVHLAVAGAVLSMVVCELASPQLLGRDLGTPLATRHKAGDHLYRRDTGLLCHAAAELDGRTAMVCGVAKGTATASLRTSRAYATAQALAGWLPLHNWPRLKALQRAHWYLWTGDSTGAADFIASGPDPERDLRAQMVENLKRRRAQSAKTKPARCPPPEPVPPE